MYSTINARNELILQKSNHTNKTDNNRDIWNSMF